MWVTKLTWKARVEPRHPAFDQWSFNGCLDNGREVCTSASREEASTVSEWGIACLPDGHEVVGGSWEIVLAANEGNEAELRNPMTLIFCFLRMLTNTENSVAIEQCPKPWKGTRKQKSFSQTAPLQRQTTTPWDGSAGWVYLLSSFSQSRRSNNRNSQGPEIRCVQWQFRTKSKAGGKKWKAVECSWICFLKIHVCAVSFLQDPLPTLAFGCKQRAGGICLGKYRCHCILNMM